MKKFTEFINEKKIAQEKASSVSFKDYLILVSLEEKVKSSTLRASKALRASRPIRENAVTNE